MGCCVSKSSQRSPGAEVWVAKEDVTLWQFSRGKEDVKHFFKKNEHFIVKRRAQHSDYEDRSVYWLFQQEKINGSEGYACRFYFYPLHYTIPEEPNPWYFGNIERRESETLLLHEQNGDGAFLVRYSPRKKAFVLSIKFMNSETSDWTVQHYNVMRTDQANGKGQFYFEPTKMFHQLEDLLDNYMEEGQRRFPTHLTNVCFVSTPLADPSFAQDLEMDTEQNQWLINRQEVKKETEVGRGNFGVVHLGSWRNTKVAVKELIAMDQAGGKYKGGAAGYTSSYKYNKEKENFEQEMEIMKKINHPNLVKMYGICVEKLPFMIIQEFCEKGDLKKYLEAFKQGTGELIRGKRYVPSFLQLQEWCSEIAKGMSYLEKKKLIHRDLAARNVLLSKNSVAKVADFGLAKEEGGGKDTDAFPILWSPPEVLSKREFSTKSDVWSYGVTVWEIFSFGEKPYGGMKHTDLKQFLKSNNRLELPLIYLKEEGAKENIKKVYAQIMKLCWEKEPGDRPTFSQLSETFSNWSMYGGQP